MTDKIKHFLLLVVLLILIGTGGFVFGYYILASDISEFQKLPLTFLLIVMLYIGGQLVKRFLQVKAPWYGWLYYIGLVAVVAPLPLLGLTEKTVVMVTRFGSLFLLIPPLLEFALLVKKKDKVEEDTQPTEENPILEEGMNDEEI